MIFLISILLIAVGCATTDGQPIQGEYEYELGTYSKEAPYWNELMDLWVDRSKYDLIETFGSPDMYDSAALIWKPPGF
jgi:hypothetical protein